MRNIPKLIVASVLLLAAVASRAQLVVEITRGQSEAVPIAVVPYGVEGQPAPALDVADVVAVDLKRSGRFAPLDKRDMIDRPTSGDQIRFQDWKYLKSDFITVGKVLAEGPDRYSVQFELFNVLNGQRLLGQKISSASRDLRARMYRASATRASLASRK